MEQNLWNDALERVKWEDKRLKAGVGAINDGTVSTSKAINNINAMVEQQKKHAFDFQNSNLSLPTVDFISNLDWNAMLIKQLQNTLTMQNVNTYDSKVRGQIEQYASVIADNYHLIGNINLPKGELKAEMIAERVAEQKAQLDQIVGRLGIINPELSESLKSKITPELFNGVVDAAKNTSIMDSEYKRTFKLNH